MASKGPGRSACRLDEARLDRLAEASEQGPAAHGFGEDQRWTLARIAELIARLFGVPTPCVGRRICCTASAFPADPGTPCPRTRRARYRHVAQGGVAGGKNISASCRAWICFEDEASQTPRPPKARTWGRRGHTRSVVVSGKGSGRVSIASLVCVRPGHRSRLIYRTLIHRRRKGERHSFAETDYAALLDAAHQQLRGPIVLIWDNRNTHISAAMRKLIAAREWLHVIRLPPYAPDLNPVWSYLKRSLGNLAAHGIDHLAAVVKSRLKRMQYQPEPTDAFFAQPGLSLDPEPP